MFDEQKFVADGFFTNKFEHYDALKKIKAVCENMCRDVLQDKFTNLAEYHLCNISQAEHESLQYKIFQCVNQEGYHREFFLDNMDFFRALIGPDIDIQTDCYVRISRPNVSSDNIGLHRDTDYGNSAFEISLSLPIIDQLPGAGLSVVPGSHLLSDYETIQVQREDVIKGTDKNVMGFLYAPKIPQNLTEDQIECISLAVGEGLGFSLGLIHGQIANTSNMTRWSIDFRFKNSFYPLNNNLKEQYYSNLVSSPVTRLASDYYAANKGEASALTFDPLLKN